MRYALDADLLASGDRCEIAKKAWNDARLIFLAFSALSLVLTTAVVVASIYAFFAFKDEQTARGWLGLVSAIATGAAATMVAYNTKQAWNHQGIAQRRVDKACS